MINMVLELSRASTIKERLEAYSMPEPNSGCWLWHGSYVGAGYGRITINGFSKRAHRVSYEEFVGPIPEGLFVCHHCDTPPCINPQHFFLGTQKDNMEDMVAKARQGVKAKQFGEKNGRAKLSKQSVHDIRLVLSQGGVSQGSLAIEYGVSRSLISRIWSNERW